MIYVTVFLTYPLYAPDLSNSLQPGMHVNRIPDYLGSDNPITQYDWGDGQTSYVYAREGSNGGVIVDHVVVRGDRVTGTFNYGVDKNGNINIGYMGIAPNEQGKGGSKRLYGEMVDQAGLDKNTTVSSKYTLTNEVLIDTYDDAIAAKFPHLSPGARKAVAAGCTSGGKNLGRMGYFPTQNRSNQEYFNYTYGLDSLDSDGPFDRDQYEAWDEFQKMPFSKVKELSQTPRTPVVKTPPTTPSSTKTPRRFFLTPRSGTSFTGTLGRTATPYLLNSGTNILADLVTDDAGRESLAAVADAQFDAAQQLQIIDEDRTWMEWINLQMAAVGPMMQ